MTTRSYRVTGMTCANCVKHVTEAVQELPGVRDVTVILEDGTLTLTSDEIDEATLAAAVDDAGYALVV